MTQVLPIKGSYKRPATWAFMSDTEFLDINDPSRAYLKRFRVVETPWFGIYIHRVLHPDARDPHDHPWNFWSFVLKGAYEEELVSGLSGETRLRDKFSLAYHKAENLHRISKVIDPTVTLVLTGPRYRKWGFEVNGIEWVEADEYFDTFWPK